MKKVIGVVSVTVLVVMMSLALYVSVEAGEKEKSSSPSDQPSTICTKKAVLVHMDDPAFPKDAKATVTYCETYTGKAVFTVQAENFPKETGYSLSINGWKDRDGNTILTQFNKTKEGLGYVDMGSVTTNASGVILKQVVAYDLPVSAYNVKLLLKQKAKPNTCVMGDDQVIFTVIGTPKPEDTIEFDLPPEIGGKIASIKGKVSNPSQTVFIVIRGQGSNQWWVQEVPLVEANGDWEALTCYFGEDDTPTPLKFEVIAFVGKEGEFTSEQTIDHADMAKLLRAHAVYQKKTTTRTK